MKKSQLLYTPIFRLAHANAKGNGSSVTLQFFPPSKDYGDGYVTITLARQLQISPESYNYADALSINLDFVELSLMLQVFRGETESINGDRGLIHKFSDGSFHHFNFAHAILDCGRFVVNLSDQYGDERHFAFTSAEALGVSVALEAALARCVFPNL